ncbi:MAG TPA: hypothetical protein VFI31_24135 [Pirellulales bacterium]|nr:hypothetical protein [Pirellulales bacterium]
MNVKPPVPKQMEGKYVLFAIVLLGVAGGGGGWWYHQHLQRRPLILWGAEAANLILRAPDVELCRLQKKAPAGGASINLLVANGETYEATDCKDATRMRGFLHLRHSLLNDYSFDWSDPESAQREWRYVLRFRDGPKTATILVSDDFGYVQLAETGAKACIQPIAEGVEQVLGLQPQRLCLKTPAT